jgi:septum formation protein
LLHLASASPRRRELLAQIGVPFARLAVDVPEVPGPGEAPEVYCLRVALAKARAGRACLPADDRRPVLGADTVVAVDERPLGKPQDRADAGRMLALLSGRTHEVYTAVALVGGDGQAVSRLSVSHVTFREVTADEAARYAASGEPDDKAGGYAVQGLGAVFIARLEGSYSGVMGLPLFETAELLREFGIDVV